MFKFKKDLEVVYTQDLYYDMFDGGYIDPEDFLEEQHAKEVRAAMVLINQFVGEALEEGYIEFS